MYHRFSDLVSVLVAQEYLVDPLCSAAGHYVLEKTEASLLISFPLQLATL